jgi:hypothetical protein
MTVNARLTCGGSFPTKYQAISQYCSAPAPMMLRCWLLSLIQESLKDKILCLKVDDGIPMIDPKKPSWIVITRRQSDTDQQKD